MTKQVEKILLQKPEVSKVFVNIGTQTGAAGAGSSNANISEISVTLVEKDHRKLSTDAFSAAMRDEITKIAGVKVVISPVSLTGGSEAPIQIGIKGVDMATIQEVTKYCQSDYS